MSAPEEFYYTYKLKDYESLSKSERAELLDQIGEYLKFTILDMVGSSKSPVSKAPKFKNKKDGEASILEDDGDLLDALEFKLSKDKTSLDIGFFDELQAAKAYGHATKMEDHPWLEDKVPRRQIIPLEGQKFKPEIRDGIDEIVQEFLDANKS
jgi:phage gpG-like protein